MSKGFMSTRFSPLNSGILATDLTLAEVSQDYMVTIERVFGKQNYAHQLLIHMLSSSPHTEPLTLKFHFHQYL